MVRRKRVNNVRFRNYGRNIPWSSELLEPEEAGKEDEDDAIYGSKFAINAPTKAEKCAEM